MSNRNVHCNQLVNNLVSSFSSLVSLVGGDWEEGGGEGEIEGTTGSGTSTGGVFCVLCQAGIPPPGELECLCREGN